MLSDPRVTWPAIRNVLPATVAYDVLLCPFVLYAVAAALRLAGARGAGRRVGWSASQARTPVPGANQGVARREPRLKLGRAGPRTSVAAYRDGHGAAASKVRFGGRRREGVLGGSLLGGASLGGSALRSSGLGSSRYASSSMGRSLLGGSVFSPSSTWGLSSALGRSSSQFPGGRLAGRAPRFSRGDSLARLTGALRGSAGPKSPGRGWLRGASSRRTSLGRNSLSGTSLGRGAFGRRRMGRGSRVWAGAGTPRLKAARTGRFGSTRLRMPRPKPKRRWRTGGYR
jgi:hypothetical protein